MVRKTQTIHRPLPTNCFSMFNRFVGLALKGLTLENGKQNIWLNVLNGEKACDIDQSADNL